MPRIAGFPGIAGEDLNRCEVPALQRKELERRLKEKPYSSQTVGYGWVRICGFNCRKGLLWRAIWKGWCKKKAFVCKKVGVLGQ